jgi:hypothetical protein
MVIRRSHHTPQDEADTREEQQKVRVPVIPALLGTLGLLNVASVVLALIEY